MQRYVLPSLKVKRIWLGLVIISGAFAILIREPIQCHTWYWTGIVNYLLSLSIGGVGAVFIGFGLIPIIKRRQ